MSTQSINGLDIPIAEVFKDFYRVPDYQREYVGSRSKSNSC